MLRFRRRRFVLAAACGIAGLVLDGGRTPTAQADTPVRSPFDVVLLAGPPRGDTTRVLRVAAGSAGVPSALATIQHRAGGAVKGVTLGDSGVAVVADVAPGDDLSFVATLFHVGLDAEAPKALCDRVVHASRPIALPDGRIAVARGVPGNAAPGAAREDALTMDAVDPATGDVRTLLREQGYLLFGVGVLDRRLVVYRITRDGADLVSVDPSGGPARTLLKGLPPFARDFEVDERRRRIVFVDRHPTETRRWQVLSLDVGTGAVTVVTEGPSLALLPFSLDDGAIVAADGDGMARVGGAAVALPAPGLFQPLARREHAGASVVTGLVSQPGTLGRPVLMRGDGSGATLVPAPASERVYVAGLVVRGAK